MGSPPGVVGLLLMQIVPDGPELGRCIGEMRDARFAPAARRGKLYDRSKNEAAAGKRLP